MNIKAMVLLAPLSCFATSTLVVAQVDPAKPETARFGNPTSTARTLQSYIYGVVKKIGPSELTLDKTEFGDDQPFKLEPKTKYVRDGKPSTLSNLKVGDKVFVDMKRDKKTGEMIAKKVVTGVAATGTL